MSAFGDPLNSSNLQKSFFCDRYNLQSINGDLAQWDMAWEKTMLTLSGSEDVYPTVCAILDRVRSISGSDTWCKTLRKLQEALVKLVESCDVIFCAAWKLVDNEKRKTHILNGLKKACESTVFCQDARAMCPEITTKAMMEQQGMAFLDFVHDLTKAIKEQASDTVYFNAPQPWSEKTLLTFTQLSTVRNEFIAQFIFRTVQSVMLDVAYRTPTVKEIREHIAEQYLVTSNALPIREKPLIRCENCTRTQEEKAFMLCSACNSKLNFTVHYCSQACQKEDWPHHKKTCGRKKVAKKLIGTIHDVFWQYPSIPNFLRPPELTPDRERLEVESLGFGTPHRSRPHSSALRRQLSLLEADRRADYFLFDEADVPIRFVIKDLTIKRMFRYLRTGAMFSAEPLCLDHLAEHLIKKMGHKPALSRARILEQLRREYEVDLEAKVTALEAQVVAETNDLGLSYLELMSM